jgi:predicted Ser/Thr protein kinase
VREGWQIDMIGDERFKVEASAIDAGGQGAIYLAEDLFYNRKVAIKILNSETTSEMSFFRKLLTEEAMLLVKLSSPEHPHPNIVYIIDVRTFNDEPAIIMEYIDGNNIHKLMGVRSRQQPLSREQVFKITNQICEGLAFAHEKGIIHRDIKPKNIMVQHRDGVVKIIDWGVAKNIDIAGRGKTYAGTPPYMSPEVVLLNRRSMQDRMNSVGVDRRTDIYSLGVTMFEMLTAGLPFSNPMTREEDILAGVNANHENYLRRKGIDAALAAVVLKAMACDPDQRYQTARQLQEALRACQQPAVAVTPVQAQPQGVVTPMPVMAQGVASPMPVAPQGAMTPAPAVEAVATPPAPVVQPQPATPKPQPTGPPPDLKARIRDALEPAEAETPDPAETARRLQRLLDQFPLEPEVYLSIAQYYVRTARTADALIVLEQGIQHTPEDASLWRMRGDLYDDQNRIDAAIHDLEHALSLKTLPAREARTVQVTLGRLKKQKPY